VYNPDVLQEQALRMYRRARAARIGSSIVGAVLGGAAASVPLAYHVHGWPIPHRYGFALVIFGLGVGAAIGWVSSEARAFRLRFEAQRTLCDLQLERNTGALLSWLVREPKATAELSAVRETA
jgi:hypothetical protein